MRHRFHGTGLELRPPSAYEIDAVIETDSAGRNVYTFVVPYENLGIDYGAELKIAPFEYTAAGPFAWYEDENGISYPFGPVDLLEKYPTLCSDGSVSFLPPETVLSRYEIGAFGKTHATASFEKVEGAAGGIRVTIAYAPAEGFWGFGVILGDQAAGKAITQLYVPGFGTIDHREYGNWLWNGNYVPAASLGVQASEKSADGKTVITLFYSYETLQSEKYGLSITAHTSAVAIQMFEYVTDASGNFYESYNCINDAEGNPLRFDGGVETLVPWKWNEALSVYTYEHLGAHDIAARLEKFADGLRLTYTAWESENLFGYGICLDLPGGAKDISLLYATTGNLSKVDYGVWTWDYQPPSVFGISAERKTYDGVTTVSLFLSYRTLGIGAEFCELGLCLFEVVNAGGAQYGIYNCMKKDGTEIAIDGGVQNFVRWNTVGE